MNVRNINFISEIIEVEQFGDVASDSAATTIKSVIFGSLAMSIVLGSSL